MDVGTAHGKVCGAPRGTRVTVAQKEGTIDEDGDAVEVVVEEVADAEDDAIKLSWTRRALGFPRLEMRRRQMHVLVLLVPHVLGKRS